LRNIGAEAVEGEVTSPAAEVAHEASLAALQQEAFLAVVARCGATPAAVQREDSQAALLRGATLAAASVVTTVVAAVITVGVDTATASIPVPDFTAAMVTMAAAPIAAPDTTINGAIGFPVVAARILTAIS
jgi:hypothetical protein